MTLQEIADYAMEYLDSLGIASEFCDGENITSFINGLTPEINLKGALKISRSDVDVIFVIRHYADSLLKLKNPE